MFIKLRTEFYKKRVRIPMFEHIGPELYNV